MSDTINPQDEILANIKKSQAGLDKKNLELRQKVKTLEDQLAKLQDYAIREPEIKSRLSKIETAYTGKVKALELKHYAEKRAWESSVDYELIAPMVFEDIEQIDKHIGKLQSFIDEQKQLSFEKMLLGGKTPQASGYTHKPSALDNLVAQDIGKHVSDY